MHKTTRNLTVFGFGLGISAIVGWLLLKENTREKEDASVTIKSQNHISDPTDIPIKLPPEAFDQEESVVGTDNTVSDDDLTIINGIGPRFAEALRASGITSIAQLAEQTPEALAEQLAHHIVINPQRIRDKAWIEQATRLV